MTERSPRPPPPRRSGWRTRDVVVQLALAIAVVWLGWEAVGSVAENMRARNLPTDFDFLGRAAGFDINQSLIDFSAQDSNWRAFFVGVLNTLGVAALGIVLSSLLGFAIGVARLSSNWIVARLASGYVEIIRNTPLLLQLLFWYNAVLKPLPAVRQSYAAPSLTLRAPDAAALIVALVLLAGALALWLHARRLAGVARSLWRSGAMALAAFGALALLGGQAGFGFLPFEPPIGVGLLGAGEPAGVYLNNRGLFLPAPVFAPNAPFVGLALALGVVAAFVWRALALRRRETSGATTPILWPMVGLALGPFVLAMLASGAPLSWSAPTLRGFNFAGGVRVYPEFVALLLGLTLYTAAFIAEIVRAGILAVPKGQGEAAQALGLRRAQTLDLVVIPQAMRVIIPPLTNQYLNLTKNSSLAVFIGFPDLVQVFAGAVFNQTNAGVQVIAMTMAVYLTISLITSLAMNLYNRRVALVER